jgi:hypothetical protein
LQPAIGEGLDYLYAETELSEQEVPVAEKKAAVVNDLSPRLTQCKVVRQG